MSVHAEEFRSWVLSSDFTPYEKNLLLNYTLPLKYNLNQIQTALTNGYPVEYIVGCCYFCDSKFEICPQILIPRVETEQIVELAVSEITSHLDTSFDVVDVGCGCGNIIISIAKRLNSKTHRFFGTDINPIALKYARENAYKILGEPQKVTFKEGNLAVPVIGQLSDQKQTSLIIANLPYIDPTDIANIHNPTYKYEPHNALFSHNGIKHYHDLLMQLKNGHIQWKNLIFEGSPSIIHSMEELTKKIYSDDKIETIIHQDLNDRERFLFVKH